MAKIGFYDMKTIECLGREIAVTDFGFNTLSEQIPKKEEENGNKRMKKQKDKHMLVSHPKNESRGHTGFLTFAIKF